MKILLYTAASISFLLMLWSVWLYDALYLKWLGQFNEEGRYFDVNECVVYSTDSAIYIVPALLFAALTVLLVFGIRNRSKHPLLDEKR